MRLSVHYDGSVIVTTPYWVSVRVVEEFIQEEASWLMRQVEHHKKSGNVLTEKQRRKNYLKHREEAREFVRSRIVEINKIYGVRFNRISIRDQRTCWGSCSAKKNLNFSYKILFLPTYLADYVIAHELCHLKELNHSKKFWSLVAQACPDYAESKKELRKHVEKV